jgi:hypothetical protein
LYFIKNIIILKELYLRGYNLTKKLNKHQKKGTLVFLRPPKHFNIGKRKVHSFRNYQTFSHKLNLKAPFSLALKSPYRFFAILIEKHQFNLLYSISSIKITFKAKIKF